MKWASLRHRFVEVREFEIHTFVHNIVEVGEFEIHTFVHNTVEVGACIIVLKLGQSRTLL